MKASIKMAILLRCSQLQDRKAGELGPQLIGLLYVSWFCKCFLTKLPFTMQESAILLFRSTEANMYTHIMTTSVEPSARGALCDVKRYVILGLGAEVW